MVKFTLLAVRRQRELKILFKRDVKIEEPSEGVGSDATTLRGTATIVGQRSNVDDFGHFDTGAVDGADS